jgi:hypothetical protein
MLTPVQKHGGGFSFLRRILDFVKLIRNLFSQESLQVIKRGSMTGMLKQNKVPGNRSIMVHPLPLSFGRNRQLLERMWKLCLGILKELRL